MRKRLVLGTLVSCALAASLSTSCQPPTTLNPLRTFDRAQRMDVVCLRIKDDLGNAIAPVPAPVATCGPVSFDTYGHPTAYPPYHLFALVTQSLRGEIAVVDLTGGLVVDQNHVVPGVNFLQVGTLPVDVASTPDGVATFVTSADPFRPAVYALPSAHILGDALGNDAPTTLATWPVCQLPQKPGPVTVIPRDGGGYDLAVVLPGDGASSAKLVTMRTAPFLDAKDAQYLTPGQLRPCPITSAIELGENVPAQWQPGDAWPDGVPWTKVDTSTLVPRGTCAPPATPSLPLQPTRGAHAHASWLVRDGSYLFIADDGLPLVHVIDVSKPGSAVELAPYLATSITNPTRPVSVSQLAISPPTHDGKRYLYALDQREGSVIVYDATDPKTASRSPLLRPHPELDFQLPDRISFSAPIVSFGFARHDYPVTITVPDGNGNQVSTNVARSGLLCNPNGHVIASTQKGATDEQLGATYRKGGGGPSPDVGPDRLRGIFAFLTLANGQMVTVDVDDWDAPCRRPAVLDGRTVPAGAALLGELAVAQSDSATDPFGVPGVGSDPKQASVGTTNEAYFPVSAPHRARSKLFLSNDASTGQNLPTIVGTPQLFKGSQPVSTAAAQTAHYPELRTLLAFDAPTVNQDQDWTITYEGALPAFDGLAATITDGGGWSTLVFDQAAGHFCSRGVHDLRVSQARVAQAAAETKAKLGPAAAQRVVDYVQLADDLLPANDPYWYLDNGECWSLPDPYGEVKPEKRYDTCRAQFGAGGDQSPRRDFPVLEAYDGRLVVGRWAYLDDKTPTTQTRVVASKSSDAYTVATMKLARCCFHNQARFRVRAGGQWLALGSQTGYLHHLTPDPQTGACVQSCETRNALLGSRALEAVDVVKDGIDRNSPFAMRSPILSAWPEGTALQSADVGKRYTYAERDLVFKFSMRGRYVLHSYNLAANTTAVSPQSMRYIEPLGQMAIVDGASLGLVLWDLNALTVSKTYY